MCHQRHNVPKNPGLNEGSHHDQSGEWIMRKVALQTTRSLSEV